MLALLEIVRVELPLARRVVQAGLQPALLLLGACANNVCLASSGSACPSADPAGDAACAGGASGATKCVAYGGGNMCTLAVVTWAVAPVQPYDLT